MLAIALRRGRAGAGGAVDEAPVPRPADLPDRDPVPGHRCSAGSPRSRTTSSATSSTRSPTTRSTRASTRCGSGSAAARPAVQIVAVTTLRDAAGQPFAPLSLDPEGLALTKDRHARDHLRGIREPADRPVGARVRARRAPAPEHCRCRPPSCRTRRGRAACARTSASRAPGRRRTAASSSPAPRTRSSRTARPRPSAPAARPGSSATTCSGASSTGSSSTGPTRSPSRPYPRPSSPSTASSSCCR